MVSIRAVISDTTVVKAKFPLPGEIASLLTSMVALPVMALFFWQRLNQAKHKAFTAASCALLLTYVASFLFVFILTVVIHIRAKTQGLCDSTILACLTLWIASKAAAFLFLIERAYIISWPITPRHKTPDYVLSYIVIFSAYFTVTVLSIKFRVAFVLEPADICIIGIQMYALIPLLLVEVLSYLYLTIRFLIPLVMVHFGGQGLLVPLRKVVIRTCIGTVIAMLSTAAVKISLTLFNGEPAWLCCMTCKIDALIACTTLHWITKPEATEGGENGTPQTLGVGFDENDKESGVVVETSQVSDNQRAASNSTTLV